MFLHIDSSISHSYFLTTMEYEYMSIDLQILCTINLNLIENMYMRTFVLLHCDSIMSRHESYFLTTAEYDYNLSTNCLYNLYEFIFENEYIH